MGGLFGRRGGNKAAPKTKPNLAIPEPTQNDDDKGGMKGNQYSQVGTSGNFRKKEMYLVDDFVQNTMAGNSKDK